MNLLLSSRDERLREAMDDPACDPARLHRTYRRFAFLNRGLSRWRTVYIRWIRPVLLCVEGRASVLDIGFGGGDVAVAILAWARADGIDVSMTGIEADARAVDYARREHEGRDIEFLNTSAEEMQAEGRTFDVVISNHLLHHMTDAELPRFLDTAAGLARRLVVFNDIRRSPAARCLYACLFPLLADTYAWKDGLISIRRSFTKAELLDAAGEQWGIFRLAPYRLVAVRRMDEGGGWS